MSHSCVRVASRSEGGVIEDPCLAPRRRQGKGHLPAFNMSVSISLGRVEQGRARHLAAAALIARDTLRFKGAGRPARRLPPAAD